MKLCATVFAFHHIPIAMSGIDGTAIRAAACAAVMARNSASHAEWRRMRCPSGTSPVGVAMVLLRVADLLRRRGVLQLLQETRVHLELRDLHHAHLNRIDVGRGGGLGGRTDAARREIPSPESRGGLG